MDAVMALILLAGLKSLRPTSWGGGKPTAPGVQRFGSSSCRCCCRRSSSVVLRTMEPSRPRHRLATTPNGGPADATNVLMIYAVKQGLEFFTSATPPSPN